MKGPMRVFPSVVAMFCAAALMAALPAPAAAQSEGRVSAGASVTLNATTDDDVGSVFSVGPLVRLNPRRGWGVAGALNWFRADLSDPSGVDAPFGRLRVRPLMGGVGYTIGPDRVLTTFSIVAGPSFNSVDFEDEFLDRVPPGLSAPAIDVDHSFAVRPGVSVTYTVAPRVGITGFGGYLINRPEVTFIPPGGGPEITDRWKADSVVLSVGVVYSIF
jgi:hypothetical protein